MLTQSNQTNRELFDKLETACLVESNLNSLGIGKLITQFNFEATIQYFISVGTYRTKTVPLSSLRRVTLQYQTRCYLWFEEEENWQTGRVFSWDQSRQKYKIELPRGQNILVSEQIIYVRCRLPLEDPTPILAMKGPETPYFHKSRSRFIQNLIQQRAASQGITGLLSANIKLYRHQVEVIRRVLEDPIQRYLLADEVGLGKTVEAAVILRQFLLDEPKGRALILVPQHLLAQWRQELEHKIYLSRFHNKVEVVAIEDWKKLQNSRDSFDFLIIDEAHHIASMSTSTEVEQQGCFQVCRHLAHSCDHLLLLSATPVLNHEQEFLAMLHLLDPVTYKLEDIEGFRDKVKKRQEIGRALLAFKESAKPFVLKKTLKQLKTLFANDTYLLNLLKPLEIGLNNKNLSSKEINQKVRGIRTHISETYRLHRRMLRNKRSDMERILNPRNAVPREEYGLDERSEQLYELLDEWRTIAPNNKTYQAIFLILFQASNTWLGVLKSIIKVRLEGKTTPTLIQDWGRENLKLITETPHFAQEQEILYGMLEILQEPSEEGDRIDLLKIIILYYLADSLEGLRSHKNNPDLLVSLIKSRLNKADLPKLIIFTSYQQTGKKLVEFLSNVFGQKAITSHLSRESQTEVAENIKRFKTENQCFCLVSDASGEEGSNLQFANGLIHFDFPVSPNRLEQRLGRIDRIGGKGNIPSWILISLEDTPQDAWYQILKNGFNIFNESIASFQFYVEDKLPELQKLIFEQGAFASSPEDLEKTIASIQTEIDQEKVKINEQSVLDEIDFLDDNSVKYFNNLIEFDSNYDFIRKSVEKLLCKTLKLIKKNDPNLDNIFYYSYNYSKKNDSLIPINEILKYFLPVLEKRGTYDRNVANQYSNVSLYRLGEGLIDSLASYVRCDDRGRAFAMWRCDENWDDSEGGEWVGFRFDYIVEIDFAPANSVLENQGFNDTKKAFLKRRGDALFPPFIQSIFLDINLEQVEDNNLLSLLKGYDNHKSKHNRDYNLANHRLPILDNFIDPNQWEKLCYRAREESEKLLKNNSYFTENCQQRASEANQKLEKRINQLSLRLQRQARNIKLKEEIVLESNLKQALITGIKFPKIRPDAVGFIILSGRKPS